MKYIKLPAKHTRYKDAMESRHGLLDVSRYHAWRDIQRRVFRVALAAAFGGI